MMSGSYDTSKNDSEAGASVTAHGRGGPPLSDLYRKYFRIDDTDSAVLRNTAYRIRYNVYCVEHAFESADDNIGGIEEDDYDAHACHAVLFHKLTGLAAGTVRIVLPLSDDPHRSFALQTVCNDPQLRQPDRFPVMRMGEVSRFCVTKDFRRRVEDLGQGAFPANSSFDADEWRRVIPNMTIGLIEWLVRASLNHGLTHWCAVMEPQLLRLLGRLGIHFQPIGGLVDYHGRRQPCVVELRAMLARVAAERPDIWDVISARGAHAAVLDAAAH